MSACFSVNGSDVENPILKVLLGLGVAATVLVIFTAVVLIASSALTLVGVLFICLAVAIPVSLIGWIFYSMFRRFIGFLRTR
ncbi:hypothetical protein NF212_22180 [Parasalinivibrio latis]|uniref:hypothetical protein n=1 Tax=Parasalinivibrio latis TaxID=2952610 RepID=UPI0030DF331B